MTPPRSSCLRAACAAAFALALAGCPSAQSPGSAQRAPLAQKWLDRAKAAYGGADMDEARDAAESARKLAPDDAEVRTWEGRVALARLDWPAVQAALAGIDTTDARGLRGRARWYAGEIDAAADELEAMLRDPDVRDPWAKAVAGLARRGAGRTPFRMSGAMLAATDMPHVLGTELVVPLEIDGEQALALIATGTAEVVLDSATRKEPAWVSLRFGGKLEVGDVPALVQDLSAISRQSNAPIKALIGVNLLRHLHATFDFTGTQLVVRNFAPPPPPSATKVPLWYFRGGGMVVRAGLGADRETGLGALLVDTTQPFALALDDAGMKKASVDLTKLEPVAQDPKLKQGTVPSLRLGAFEIPSVPAVTGVTSIAELEHSVEADLDGVLGSGLLAAFRVTLTDEGRAMWLEDLPSTPPPSPKPAASSEPSPASPALPPSKLHPKPKKKPAPHR